MAVEEDGDDAVEFEATVRAKHAQSWLGRRKKMNEGLG